MERLMISFFSLFLIFGTGCGKKKVNPRIKPSNKTSQPNQQHQDSNPNNTTTSASPSSNTSQSAEASSENQDHKHKNVEVVQIKKKQEPKTPTMPTPPQSHTHTTPPVQAIHHPQATEKQGSQKQKTNKVKDHQASKPTANPSQQGASQKRAENSKEQTQKASVTKEGKKTSPSFQEQKVRSESSPQNPPSTTPQGTENVEADMPASSLFIVYRGEIDSFSGSLLLKPSLNALRKNLQEGLVSASELIDIGSLKIDNKTKKIIKGSQKGSVLLNSTELLELANSKACRTDLTGPCLLVIEKNIYFAKFENYKDSKRDFQEFSLLKLNPSMTLDELIDCEEECGPLASNCDQSIQFIPPVLKDAQKRAKDQQNAIVAYSWAEDPSEIRRLLDKVTLKKILSFPKSQKGLGKQKAINLFKENAQKYDQNFFRVPRNMCKLVFTLESKVWHLLLAFGGGGGVGTIMCDHNGDGDASEDITLVRVNVKELGAGLGLQFKSNNPLYWFRIDQDIAFSAYGLSTRTNSKQLANCLHGGIKANVSLLSSNPSVDAGLGSLCTNIDKEKSSTSNPLVLHASYGSGKTKDSGSFLSRFFGTTSASINLGLITIKDRSDEF